MDCWRKSTWWRMSFCPGPAARYSAGRSSRAIAIIMPGLILSQPAMKTTPS